MRSPLPKLPTLQKPVLSPCARNGPLDRDRHAQGRTKSRSAVSSIAGQLCGANVVTFNTMSPLFGLFGALLSGASRPLRFTFRRVEFATNICHVHMRRWQLQAHLSHRVGNDLRYGKIPEPLVIGWNDVPRRTLCAGQSDGVLVRLYVFWP